MPRVGTPKVIGFLMAANRPLNEYYLNEGVAWADTATALAGIPSSARSDGMLVKIGVVDYWFLADLTTLEIKSNPTVATAGDIPIIDAPAIYTATNVEDALMEVMGYANSLGITLAALPVVTLPYRILLGAYSSVAGRVAAWTPETETTGWTLAVDSTYNLLITHTLTGSKVSGVNIFEIDGDNERLLVPFNSAFSGVVNNTPAQTVLIEGLAPTTLAIRIELTFN